MRTISTSSLLGVVIVGSLLVGGGTRAAGPVFEKVVYPAAGVTSTSVTGINARGDVVGQYIEQPGNVRHGFRMDKQGTYTSIDYPGAVATNAWGINSPGDIAGDFRMTPTGVILGFVLRNGIWTTVDCGASLGAVHTFAFGITASGEAAGEYKLPGVSLGSPGRAFLYTDGVCTDITPPAAGGGASVAVAWSLNESGVASGYYLAAGVTRGWMRDRDGVYSTVDYPASVFTNVRGVSASGDMVGLYRFLPPPNNRGFLLTADGEFGEVDYPGSTATRALGINARGDMVGDYRGGDCPAGINCGWVLR